MKARRLGLRKPEDLESLAICRGCKYYDTSWDSPRECPEIYKNLVQVSADDFSNVELALALLSPSLPKSQRRIRMGGAILVLPEMDPDELVRLAKLERSESIVAYIAHCGAKIEPENVYWSNLLNLLPAAEAKPGVLPHITRFITMTGITRNRVGIERQWIRPVPQLAS